MLVLTMESGLSIWKLGWFHRVTVILLSQLTSDLASWQRNCV